jgi:putative endonuclease
MKSVFRIFFQNKDVGRIGEDIATRFLKKAGYVILERNYKNSKGYRLGEIDIIARDGETIVFVEVKARKFLGDSNILPPEINITRVKLHKLDRIAQSFLRERGLEGNPYRFDALAVTLGTLTGDDEIRHIQHMFL